MVRILDQSYEFLTPVHPDADVSVLFTLEQHLARNLAFDFPSYFTLEPEPSFDGELTIIRPTPLHVETKSYQYWIDAVEEMEKAYLRLLELGEAPEVAHCIIPLCQMSQVVGTASLKEWELIIKMYCMNDRHLDIKDLMCELKNDIKTKWPTFMMD